MGKAERENLVETVGPGLRAARDDKHHETITPPNSGRRGRFWPRRRWR